MISKAEMQVILGHLDSALTASVALDAPLRRAASDYEGHITWSIRIARKRLLQAAIADVEVEHA